MTTGVVKQYLESQATLSRSRGERFRIERAPVVPFPLSIERDYIHFFVRLTKQVADDVKELLFPAIPDLVRVSGGRMDASRFNLEDVDATVETIMGDVTARLNNRHLRGLEEAVDSYRQATSLKVMEQLRRQIRGMIQLDAFPPDSGADRKILDSWVATNRKRIKALTTAEIEEVEDIARRGFQNGDRANLIQKRILDRFPVVASRAALIARDQVNKLRGNLTRTRQTSLGIDKYVWRTSRDERVRESHLVKEGKVFSWDKPPADTGHPGQDIQCRCTAEPYIEEEPPAEEDRAEVIAEVRRKRARMKRQVRAAAERRRARVAAPPVRGPHRRGVLVSRARQRPADPKQAQVFDAVDAWVHGSGSRSAVLMKHAAKKAFGLEGVPFTRAPWTITDAEVKGAMPTVRRMYRQTQTELRKRGVKKLRLYRGIKRNYKTAGALESYSTDVEVAKDFAGPGGKVIVEDVPADRILNGVDMTHWHNGRFGNQSEWIVMQ